MALGNRRAQAAEMVIEPGESEGGPDNRHRGADQWLFVVSGQGAANVNVRRVPLRAGALLLIERGDTHEIRNTGRTLLKTLSVYVPPAYTKSGESCRADGADWNKRRSKCASDAAELYRFVTRHAKSPSFCDMCCVLEDVASSQSGDAAARWWISTGAILTQLWISQ